MRQRITIQQLTEAQDAQGAKSESWATYATVWAAIRPLRGREFLEAKQLQARVSHEIRARWLSGVTPAMQITVDSRTFRIESAVNENERNETLLMMCEEVLS